MAPLLEKRLIDLLKEEKRPLKLKEIAKALKIKKSELHRLKRILKNLAIEGSILKLRNKRFKAQEKKGPGILDTKKHITGFVRKRGRFYFLVEEEKRGDTFLIKNSSGELREGLLAVARKKNSGCEILRTFESLDNVRKIREFVTLKYGLPSRFKKKAEESVRNPIKEICVNGREDLRHVRHVTIDGEKAKDFDDAVAIEKKKDGYVLYVSIADVSHYVVKGSFLDQEAYERGMSIYFPDSVIPMLPKILSNNLCSLQPKKDRFAFSVILHFNNQGDVVGFDFKKSIIRSLKRLTYHEVEKAIVKGSKEERKRLKDLITDLEIMKELTEILLEKRAQRGSLDFDLPEPEIMLDMAGEITNILRSERLFSHRIIEEFMIVANRNVAEFLTSKGAPALFRVHEPPDKEKLRGFEEFLRILSINPKKEFKGIKRFQEIIKEAKDKPYEFIVNKMLLRSMKQAHYEPENKGHFGLGLESYLHFTSPIRRYPDLVCHRILGAILSQKKIPYSDEELLHMAEHLSEKERTIMEIEREIEDRIRILFMKEKIGEEYDGIITHVASFGFFVELFDVFVEGVILVSDLHDDYYIVDKDRFYLQGKRRKKTFRIGDTLRVRVVAVDVERKFLRFLPL